MQQAPDCDMMLAHDNNLVAINEIGDSTVSGLLNCSCTVLNILVKLLETLKPDVMMDLLQRSNIQIHQVLCGELPT